jgi:hypothetical protein
VSGSETLRFRFFISPTLSFLKVDFFWIIFKPAGISFWPEREFKKQNEIINKLRRKGTKWFFLRIICINSLNVNDEMNFAKIYF